MCFIFHKLKNQYLKMTKQILTQEWIAEIKTKAAEKLATEAQNKEQRKEEQVAIIAATIWKNAEHLKNCVKTAIEEKECLLTIQYDNLFDLDIDQIRSTSAIAFACAGVPTSLCNEVIIFKALHPSAGSYLCRLSLFGDKF